MSTTPLNPIVELQIDGEWVDITPDCRQGSADSGGGFEITRGVPNEGNFAEPTQFNFVLNNGESKVMPGQSGIYSPTNPMGPWFGKLGRNQKVRIGLDRRIDSFDRDPGAQSVQKIDGTFETAAAASQWKTPTGGTFSVVSDTAYRGNQSARLVVAAGSPPLTYVRQTNSFVAPVVVGSAYTASAQVMSPTAVSNVGFVIDWYDAAFGYLSTSSFALGAMSPGVWTPASVTGTAPASAAFAGYGLTITAGTTGQTAYYDDIDIQYSTAGGGWGSLPDHLHADGTTLLQGETYHYWGDAGMLSTGAGMGRIAGDSTLKAAFIPKQYRDVDILMRFKMVGAIDTEVGVFARMSQFSLPFPSGMNRNDATGWTTSANGTLSTDTTVTRNHNTSSIRLDIVTTTASTVTITPPTSIPTYFVLPRGSNAATYRAGVWLKSTNAANCRVGLAYFDINGTSLGSLSADTAIPANIWTFIKADILAPQDAAYVRVYSGYSTGANPQAGWKLWHSDIEVRDTDGAKWYSASIIPSSNILKVGKVSDDTTLTRSVTLPVTLTSGTFYWMRTQMTGQRIRTKIWQDGTAEPTAWPIRYYDDRMDVQDQVGRTGEVGILSNGGTTDVYIDSLQIDQWRAHTEISQLPARFDLSRTDFWVPVQSRGILRRLNQGRKALKSPVSLHLEEYSDLSYGWWPLESDEGDSAGNAVARGLPGTITGLTFSDPDSSGNAALPGVSGIATLDTDTSVINLSVPTHTNSSGKESFLWFMRLPNLPASTILIATLYSTGTVRTWYVYVQSSGALQVVGKDRNGLLVADTTTAGWNGNADLPTGCWLACVLYLTPDGGNVDYALNHHRPGSEIFWSNNGTYVGTTGNYTGVNFRSSAAHTAAGNLQLTQLMHYAGDLPFVDYDFRRAAMAYDGEEAAARIIRLAANANVAMTTTGISSVSVPLGVQTPSKLVELWEESAEADDGFVMEERDDFGLTFVTRNGLWNRDPVTLHIDEGHLTTPLEPDTDDQKVRNDVTVTRPGGSFRRAIQTSGPLNINEPEVDPDGVGVYDEQKTINVGTDDLCGSQANWRVSRGTQAAPRYPSFTANMASRAFQSDPALAADVMSTDPGDAVMLHNTETDFVPRRQQVSAYTETMRDLYDWMLTFTAAPADVRKVGQVSFTTRIGTDGNITTAAPFTAGTDTALSVANTDGVGFVALTANDDRHWPFEVEVEGVRLEVVSTGQVINSDPGFEVQGLPNWEVTSANVTMARDLYDAKRGSYCVRVASVAAGTDGVQNQGLLPVTAGQTYLVSGWVKTELAATDIRICTDWYISGVYSTSGLPTPITTSANVWTWFSATVVAPASVNGAKIRCRNVYASAYRAWYDNVRLVLQDDYIGSGQVLQVTQTPTNAEFGVTGKVIPSGSVVRVVDAMRLGWGESN